MINVARIITIQLTTSAFKRLAQSVWGVLTLEPVSYTVFESLSNKWKMGYWCRRTEERIGNPNPLQSNV